MFQLLAKGVRSCSLCYMSNLGDAWHMAIYYDGIPVRCFNIQFYGVIILVLSQTRFGHCSSS